MWFDRDFMERETLEGLIISYPPACPDGLVSDLSTGKQMRLNTTSWLHDGKRYTDIGFNQSVPKIRHANDRYFYYFNYRYFFLDNLSTSVRIFKEFR